METLPKALNRVAARQGKEYKTSHAGKWGIGGSAWLNSPQGVDYDKALCFGETRLINAMDGSQ